MLDKTRQEIELTKADLAKIKWNIEEVDKKKTELIEQREKVAAFLYKQKLQLLHVEEIYRLAATQFSRLRNVTPPTLTLEDEAELNKWIGRCKSIDSMKDIIAALDEVRKYYPREVKTSIYALVQKIIIGGPYKSKRKPSK